MLVKLFGALAIILLILDGVLPMFSLVIHQHQPHTRNSAEVWDYHKCSCQLQHQLKITFVVVVMKVMITTSNFSTFLISPQPSLLLMNIAEVPTKGSINGKTCTYQRDRKNFDKLRSVTQQRVSQYMYNSAMKEQWDSRYIQTMLRACVRRYLRQSNTIDPVLEPDKFKSTLDEIVFPSNRPTSFITGTISWCVRTTAQIRLVSALNTTEDEMEVLTDDGLVDN